MPDSSSPRCNFEIDKYLIRISPRNRLDVLPRPISHFLGYRANDPRPAGTVIISLWSFIGTFSGLAVVAAVFRAPGIAKYGGPEFVGSLGATAILSYTAPYSPFAQPRNTFISQLAAAIIGVSITKLFLLLPDSNPPEHQFHSLSWLAGCLAVACTSVFMGLTGCIHPPSGATALLAATDSKVVNVGWFYIALVLLGNVLICAVACIVDNLQGRFPLYWWTGGEVGQARKADRDPEKGKQDEGKGGKGDGGSGSVSRKSSTGRTSAAG